MGEALKELGKHLLNLAVAIIVFVILQPLMAGKMKNFFTISAVIVYLFIVSVGFLLIKKGKELEDSKNE